ncbi:nucleoside triphosphate pyrophosphohydrolase family protein [Spirosoma sp. BT702]|uniref:Nucleoside triphosphate pyrophosphohydrolase family protein n=1 Tax=Spirosoma profusum TaxID=2771354 RepID=A0A926Y569_9BACT|nr:nucleoside triphosphate pyrophosphohydrolase family protein [Spirosoma profusum]MBD2704270.1 nucleoside triphosphate pyrophosphohydrolase family protein [Spirosoma profusum]
MQQPDSLNQVAEFHRTFHAPVLESPQIPSEARSQLRVALLAEELDELRDAIAENDIVAVADALCDLQYVLSGAVLEFGLGHQFKALFDEVQRSNMSKACLTVEEAEATVATYQSKGVPCHFIESDGKYLVFRDADHKTLKSVNYSPADLVGVLERNA